ncbi:MAG TPA: VWA domain-containing protein [Candidatus Acidoferrales bacterium]|nr:VWA domain-containing protein [Candidatus Acidoferrales bacterium]
MSPRLPNSWIGRGVTARSLAHAFAALFVVSILAVGLSFARQQPIRVNTNLVQVNFTARDTQGALVTTLTKDDLELLEDSTPQSIAFFARSTDVPLTLGLVLDISGSQSHFGKQHQHDLEVFLKNVLGPKDRAFLVCFADHIRLISDFSPSSTALTQSLEGFEHDKHPKYPELGPPEDRDGGTAFYDSIYDSVAEKLAGENGRRALLIFSDGEDNSSAYDEVSAIQEAQRADVPIFTIRYTETHHGKLNATNKYGIRVMDRIAADTGAAAFDSSQMKPEEYFKQIEEDLRSSYEVGYYTTNSAKDGTFRKVVIRAKQPGYTIRAKPGYYAR